MSTEIALREWRSGHTLAERLCAQVLGVEGFTNIDPQAPLGGADGGKNILAQRDGLRWVPAVYFPPTHPTLTEIKSKFTGDLDDDADARDRGYAKTSCEATASTGVLRRTRSGDAALDSLPSFDFEDAPRPRVILSPSAAATASRQRRRPRAPATRRVDPAT